MPDLHVVYWRDIPAQVIARAGRTRASIELAPRFAEAIDAAAMRAGLRDSDAYLDEWRRGVPLPCGDDLDAAAKAEAARIEAEFPDDRVRSLVRNLGLDAGEEHLD
jgi:hypothetical protein